MRVYLVCFDIEDDRCRRKLGDLLLRYGDRVQYSVFEISLDNEDALETLCRKCQKYVEESDKLYFYWLNKESRKKCRDVWGERIAVFPAGIIL